MSRSDPAKAPAHRPADGSGKLYVVATPIGNLADLGGRARAVLSEVNLILAEDTRRTRVLLQHYGIETRAIAFHEHNETDLVERLVERLREGEDLAVVSDAGTPLISDPGFELVRRLHREGLEVVPVPGPSALLCALSVACVPVDRFVFEGFLPARRGARRARLAQLDDEPRTMVFYEAPHRIVEALADLGDAFGGSRPAMIAKELTKLHETLQGGTLDELRGWVAGDEQRRRGEFVLVVGGADDPQPRVEIDAAQLLAELLEDVSVKRAAEIAAKLTGARRNTLYKQALALAKSD